MTHSTFSKLLDNRGIRNVDLARAAKVDLATVTRWVNRRVPAERVLQIESLTGISRHEIRPDIYGAKPQPERMAS